MLEGEHDYKFVKFMVKNKYSEKDISIYNFRNANKNNTEINFISNFTQDNQYNTKKLAIKIETGKQNLKRLMRHSLPLIFPAMDQLQLIYLTDLDSKKPSVLIREINNDLKSRRNTYNLLREDN